MLCLSCVNIINMRGMLISNIFKLNVVSNILYVEL